MRDHAEQVSELITSGLGLLGWLTADEERAAVRLGEESFRAWVWRGWYDQADAEA